MRDKTGLDWNNYDIENIEDVREQILSENEDDVAYTMIQINSYNDVCLSKENADLAADILFD